MSKYRPSSLAEFDLDDILDYTAEKWGDQQADRYLESLIETFDRISQMSGLGRPCGHIRRGYRRIEHGKHVIFYRLDGDGVFINRILHQQMLAESHLFEAE